MRLIDADAIEPHEQLAPMGNGQYEYVQIAYMDDIDALPTIEPERKKGHWVKLYTNNYKCSECGDWWGSDDNEMIEDFKFCPNCGADMRGETHEKA